LALGGGQSVMATTVVQVSLLDPVADRLRGRLELAGKLLGAATGSNELDDLLQVFRRVPQMGPGIVNSFSHKHEGVHVTG